MSSGKKDIEASNCIRAVSVEGIAVVNRAISHLIESLKSVLGRPANSSPFCQLYCADKQQALSSGFSARIATYVFIVLQNTHLKASSDPLVETYGETSVNEDLRNSVAYFCIYL